MRKSDVDFRESSLEALRGKMNFGASLRYEIYYG